MPIFLAYETAVEAICYLRTREKDDTPWRRPSRKTSIYDAIHTKRELTELRTSLEDYLQSNTKQDVPEEDVADEDDGLFFIDELTDLTQEEIAERNKEKPAEPPSSILDHLSRPLHILVPTALKNTQTDTLIPHVWADGVPTRAFIEVEPGVFLSTPAFTFLQMATELTCVELIQLAMQFCGFYSPGPAFGRGTDPISSDTRLAKLHRTMVATASVFDIDPVCSTKMLERFIGRSKGFRGVKQARAALNMALDHSASHMETDLYLLFCLPVRMGGYGLPKPVLNPKVIVEQASGPSVCYPDQFWSGFSIDVEYDSNAEHCGPSAHYRDSKRMVAIVCNRITYLSISTGQLYSVSDFDNAARGLARMLKHRVRYTNVAWREERRLVRTAMMLPTD